MLLKPLKQQMAPLWRKIGRFFELLMQKVLLELDRQCQVLLSQVVLLLLQLKQQHLPSSTMLLGGHLKNTILMINDLLLSRSIAKKTQFKRILQRLDLVLYEMKPLVIIMMLLLDSTMMEIHVCLHSLISFQGTFSNSVRLCSKRPHTGLGPLVCELCVYVCGYDRRMIVM